MLPIILKIRLTTMAMASVAAAGSPVPVPTQAVAVMMAGEAAAPVQVNLYDENEHQTGTIAIWRDGATDDETSAAVKKLFHCRTTHREKMMAKQTLAMLAAVSERFGNRTIEYVSAYRVGHEESPTSPHRDGRAIDFRIRGIQQSLIRDYVWKSYTDVGVGWYPAEQFVHIDTRPKIHDTAWTFLNGVNHYHPYWAELVRQPTVATAVSQPHRAGS